uniref:Flotillin-like n=2 Tax=Populus alba TaxID=43335 RepID=A0A4U5PZ78_POPAL|nr:hypothetical protein D5086_0000157490 [Populus alba]
MDPQQQRTGAPQHGPPQNGGFSPILTVFLSFLSLFALLISPSPVLNCFSVMYIQIRLGIFRAAPEEVLKSIRNFKQMEEERTKVLISIETQRVVEKQAETTKKMAVSEAEKNANVGKILMEQKMMEKDSARQKQEIENQMNKAHEKSLADAAFYRVMKEAEANKLKLTPQFLELKFIEAIADNTKNFFGDKVLNMVPDQRLLGNFLQRMSGEMARIVNLEEVSRERSEIQVPSSTRP